jgi:uncharacterized glyoxalase superfamily protein PhnB
MKIVSSTVVFDTNDIEAETAFWAALIGGEVDEEDRDDPHWRDILVGGELRVSVQYAEDHIPPTWPPEEGDQHQQVHVDFNVEPEDFEDACREALSLGATSIREPRDKNASHGFHVFADPSGHPFCICWV